MTFEEILALGEAIQKLVEEAPELVDAIQKLVSAVRTKTPLTPYVKHLEAIAAARKLNIRYP